MEKSDSLRSNSLTKYDQREEDRDLRGALAVARYSHRVQQIVRKSADTGRVWSARTDLYYNNNR